MGFGFGFSDKCLKSQNLQLKILVYLIHHVEQTFNASVCQVYGKYTKTKSEIMKHYQEKNKKKIGFES